MVAPLNISTLSLRSLSLSLSLSLRSLSLSPFAGKALFVASPYHALPRTGTQQMLGKKLGSDEVALPIDALQRANKHSLVSAST